MEADKLFKSLDMLTGSQGESKKRVRVVVDSIPEDQKVIFTIIVIQ